MKPYETRGLELLGLKSNPAWDDPRGDQPSQERLRRFGLTP